MLRRLHGCFHVSVEGQDHFLRSFLCVCLCLPAMLMRVLLQLSVCPLDEGCISFILARVLGALVYLHGAGRLHRWERGEQHKYTCTNTHR